MKLEIKVPEVGESINEVTLSKWLVADGSYVELDQPVCELESDKATFELPAEEAGTIKITAEEGTDQAIGAVLGSIDTSSKAPEKVTPAATPNEKIPVEDTATKKEENPAQTKLGTTLHISPLAAEIIKEKGLNEMDITGSGANGRITKQDVLSYIKNQHDKQPQDSNTNKIIADFSRDERSEPMSRLRRTIAARLVESKNQTAMLTTFNEVDMSKIIAIRSKYKEPFKEKYGVSLGYMSFFTRAVCLALNEFPTINARIEDKDIVYHNFTDISIAISTPRGLIVPVIRNAESLSMAEIELAVADLATRGRDNQLSLEEMTGGTFTITNGGVFGSLLSTPIINIPQSAILGMHKIQERPMAVDGQVIILPMMYLALSYDHRIVDGKESVSFLIRVKELLENPDSLLTGADPILGILGL